MRINFLNHVFYSPSGDGGMYYGTTPYVFQRAAELRNTMTPAEASLWKSLHINEWKLKFRRQHPIANYVVDFYCHSLKLVIEIDGDVHDKEDVKKKDTEREQFLKNLGLTVLRFKNEEVYKNRQQLLNKIGETISLLNTNVPAESEISSSPSGDRGTLYIIKIGGNIIDDEVKLAAFLLSFSSIKAAKILVHGGGKLATKLAAQLGIEQQMIDGRRITDAETLKVVTMVYAGFINKNIVAQLQANGCNAIGLCGADGNVIEAHKRQHPTIDYGFVGDVDAINTTLLQSLLEQDINVVLAPITHNAEGLLLNTNADTIAQEIAQAMSQLYEVDLIYSFEKPGVLLDINDDNSVIHSLNLSKYGILKKEQKIFAGMIPKLDNAFAALSKGVQRVVIGKAEQLEQLVAQTAGTSIVN